MKKNIYIIMSEADVPELEALLENTECEMPEGISAENIAAKVKIKQKKARAKARAAWLRFGAAAACLALIIAAVPTAQYILGATQSTTSRTETLLHINTPSIAYPTSISYTYHLPLKDGTCLAKEIFFELEEGKTKETWRELLAPFFEHCGLDVSVAEWKLTETGAKTETDGEVVTHTPGVKTLHLYFESEEVLDDHTLKCLVNTIDSISYVRYIKLYHNGEPVAIDGNCPEEGFVNFRIDAKE
jgi:hypothetical protein